MSRNNLKRNQEIDNPCLKEQNLSYKCLNDNNFEHSKCELHFLNYKTCKEFWNHVRLDRKRHGIYPNMPSVEDRPQVKEEYMIKRGMKN